MKRWIDTAVTKFNVAMWAITIGHFVLIAVWVFLTKDQQFPYLNTAFVVTWLIAIVMTIPILWYAKRRPIDQEPTWGEAMLGATYVFALLFWIYGVVPHQWLVFADSELNWRSDVRLVGPRLPWGAESTIVENGVEKTVGEGVISWALPFEMNYRVIRDLIAVNIYVFGLAANMAVWSIWQKRGQELPSTELETSSRYGRPCLLYTSDAADE